MQAAVAAAHIVARILGEAKVVVAKAHRKHPFLLLVLLILEEAEEAGLIAQVRLLLVVVLVLFLFVIPAQLNGLVAVE
jgi:hypothetical protein